jgi:hypothetical protein
MVRSWARPRREAGPLTRSHTGSFATRDLAGNIYPRRGLTVDCPADEKAFDLASGLGKQRHQMIDRCRQVAAG